MGKLLPAAWANLSKVVLWLHGVADASEPSSRSYLKGYDMLPGECSGMHGVKCDCGKDLSLKICYSAAGHYLGYWCSHCGPWSRETKYFRTRAEAEKALKNPSAYSR